MIKFLISFHDAINERTFMLSRSLAPECDEYRLNDVKKYKYVER